MAVMALLLGNRHGLNHDDCGPVPARLHGLDTEEQATYKAVHDKHEIACTRILVRSHHRLKFVAEQAPCRASTIAAVNVAQETCLSATSSSQVGHAACELACLSHRDNLRAELTRTNIEAAELAEVLPLQHADKACKLHRPLPPRLPCLRD